MGETTLSTKYQIVIPKEVRRELRLKPKQKFVVLSKNGVIQLVPKRSIQEMRGFLAGKISLEDALKDLRDKTDRF